MISYKSFKEVTVDHYFRKLYEGEKHFGRHIFIEHDNTDHDEMTLTFIRFINQISATDDKIVGFQAT